MNGTGLHVVRLGSTPLKGTRHQALDAVDLDADGPVGDRVFCLVDPARARVLRTIENPRLIAVSSRWDGRSLSCEFPDGRTVVGEVEPGGADGATEADYWGRSAALETVAGPWAAAFSSYLGFPVELARIRSRGAVVYGRSVTVLHAGTLSALTGRLDQLCRPGHSGHSGHPGRPTPEPDDFAARFRSTVVLDGGGPLPESDWIGGRLRLGAAELEICGPVPRCAVIDLNPASGVRDLAVLRAAGVRPGHEPAIGVDAVVTRPGRVATGDPAALIDL